MRIGVDVGGTKIEVIALDQAGKVLLRERVATPKDDYPGTVKAICGLVEMAEAKTGQRGSVGVGIPGTISGATGLIKNSNSLWLIGHAFDKDISAGLSRPVRLANDANCFAVSEARDGAGAGHAVVFGSITGTGVGGGISIDGRALAGANGIAGEWGHNPLPRPTQDEVANAPDCYCGKKGCIEAWCSGPALALQYRALNGENLTTNEIAEASAAGDAIARQIIDGFVDRFSRALAHIVNIIDPDVIVLGGGLSNIERLYEDLPPRVKMAAFNPDRLPLIRKNYHGDSSGVRGAAWLWGDDETGT